MSAPASPVLEEATRLLEALQAWAAGAGGVLPLAGESAECSVCPVCQLLRAVRGIRPEVVEHLAGASAELLAALRSAVSADVPPPASTDRRRVEHIDIRD